MMHPPMELDTRIAEQAGADPADAQFRLLVESVSDYAIFLLDTAGRVMSWNPGAERIKGYAASEIIGRPNSVFYPVEDRTTGKPEQLLRRAEREGRVQDEGWRVRKDGSRFWADVVLTALRERSGKLSGFAKVTRDGTALRHEREREQLLKEVFEGAPGGISMCEPRSGRIVRANPALQRFFGYTEQELYSRTIRDITHPDDIAETLALVRQLMAGERQYYITEKRYVRKDGSVFWARLMVSKVGEYLLAQVEDISERKRADAQIRELLERQRALAELSLLALGETSLERVLDRAVVTVREHLKTHFVRVLELLPERDAARLVAGSGWKPGTLGSVIAVRPNSLLESTLRSPPAVFEDLADESYAGSGMLQDHGVVSGVSVVIHGGAQPWGIIGAHSGARRAFERADAEFLQAVANVVSAAIGRRRAHEQVRASEARLQGFTDHSPAVMFLKDADGRYRFVNQQFLQRFGLRAEQVIGRTDGELFPREQAVAFAANDAQVMASGQPVHAEETARYVDGERVSVVVKFPVFDADGRISGIGGVATDITERKRTEQALLEQRTLLQEAQKVAGLGCWEWDPSSGRVSWSPELCRMYGFDAQDFEPSFENYLERVHPDDRQHSGAMVARALMDGRGYTLDERIRRPDGSVRYLRSHGEVVKDESGKPRKLLGASLDITEQRNSEAALRAAASSLQALTRRLVEAEEAERHRIAGELHDRVGQNLSALNINLDIVLGALGETGPQDLRVRLRDSLALVDGTLQSIENVMAELRPPLLEEYGLGAALGWYAEEFSRRNSVAIEFDDYARERNRQLRPEAAAALFRICQEALNNIAKHAKATRVRIALAVEDGQMAVSIADDGAGFDPSAATEARASRWGMTTMRERAEAAGGSLEIRSAPGQGTKLRATVPF